MKPVAAFFDLDGTLIDVNSGFRWAQHERRAGNVSSWEMARVMMYSAMYKLALIDIERVFAEAVGRYRGVPRDALEARTHAWFHEHIAARLRPGAARALETHREMGHRLVLLTSASGYEAAAATETWKLDAWLANDLPVDASGLLTGASPSPLCYGPGKVTHAEAFAALHDIDLDRSWFYTDSYTDLPMLERVGEPRVVRPDPRLARAARKRGWEVCAW